MRKIIILLVLFVTYLFIVPQNVLADDCSSDSQCLPATRNNFTGCIQNPNPKQGGYICQTKTSPNIINSAAAAVGSAVGGLGAGINSGVNAASAGVGSAFGVLFGWTQTQQLSCDGAASLDTAIGCIKFETYEELFGFILRWAIGVGGGIAFLLILYAGFQIMTSAGDPQRLKSGQELLTAAISGLIMLIFSVFILRVIGVDILGIIPK